MTTPYRTPGEVPGEHLTSEAFEARELTEKGRLFNLLAEHGYTGVFGLLMQQIHDCKRAFMGVEVSLFGDVTRHLEPIRRSVLANIELKEANGRLTIETSYRSAP